MLKLQERIADNYSLKYHHLQAKEYDIALWEAFLKGDQQAFGLLFKNNYAHLFQYGSKICRNMPLLEDTIQELFLEIWKSRNPVPTLSVRAYLLKALKYKLLKEFARNNTASLQDDLADDSFFDLGHEAFLIEKQEDEERSQKLMLSLQQLSHRQKEIIYLKFYQNLSYEEVSAIMNINYQAARNLLYHAIKALKKIIQLAVLI